MYFQKGINILRIKKKNSKEKETKMTKMRDKNNVRKHKTKIRKPLSVQKDKE